MRIQALDFVRSDLQHALPPAVSVLPLQCSLARVVTWSLQGDGATHLSLSEEIRESLRVALLGTQTHHLKESWINHLPNPRNPGLQ